MKSSFPPDEQTVQLLIVDDEVTIRLLFEELLAGPKRVLHMAGSVAEGSAIAARTPIDVALVDKNLPDGSGLRLVSELKRNRPGLEAIVITAYASFESAVEAVQLSLFDYVTKPFDDLGRLERLVQNAIDKVALVRRERSLHRQMAASEERYALAMQATSDVIWDWNLATNDFYFSPRWAEMLGLDGGEVTRTPNAWFSRVHPDDGKQLKRQISELFQSEHSTFEAEHRILHRSGEILWIRTHAVCLREDGAVTRMVGAQSNITRRKQMEAQLVHDGLHDALTGLPNRALFMDRLEHVLRNAKRPSKSSFAVIFIDLDRFKNINESMGHLAGDELLIAVASRLQDSAGKADTLARLGGDEFAVLLDKIEQSSEVTVVVHAIEASLRIPVYINNQPVVTTASIGIAIGDEQYENAEDILRDADTAMYRAKSSGKARHEVFVGNMRTAVVKFLQVETNLRQAIERAEFVVHYQPILRLNPFALVGFEGLVRWRHPVEGLISPMEFIPVAEETGAIVEIGELVLRAGCQQVECWRREHNDKLFVSLNLSPRQFSHPGLVPMIRRVLDATGLASSALRLEITESVFIGDVQRAIGTLEGLKNMGIKLYLDDFGTGYSSLSYLHRLPFDVLKVDRAFVRNLLKDGKSKALVEGIVRMSMAIGIQVVAEGIEDHEQFEALRQLGCDYGQGFYFSRPLRAHHATKLIAATTPNEIRAVASNYPSPLNPSDNPEAPLSKRASTTLELLKELKSLSEQFGDNAPKSEQHSP